jgi:beta-xylosidase
MSHASHIFRYTNPITREPALAMRDHQIIKVGDTWYMTGTTPPFWTGRNPGVRLFSSPDLLHWKFENWLIDGSKLPDDCYYNGRFWAPEIHRAHGRFFLTVNSGHKGQDDRYMQNHGIVLFVAAQITGPYELVTTGGPIGRGFKNDATLFTDHDGQSYLYCSGGGLWQARIDLATGRLIDADDLQKIIGPRDTGNPEWMIGGIEGPFVIRRQDTYFMLFSSWTRGYEVGVLTAATPLGPWRLSANSPIMSTRKRRYRQKQMQEGGYDHLQFADTVDPFVETGHCAVFEGLDGRDWLCCHYFPEGRQPIDDGPVREYKDTQPQLGIEPLRIENGLVIVNGPTWTEQVIEW